MTFDELVNLCSLYCDSCEVMVYMNFTMAREWKLLSLHNFGVNQDRRYQLTNMQEFATEIEFIEIRPEVRRIYWKDIVFD
jgi:hypothetical protein